MIRLLTFIVVIGGLALYFYLTSKPQVYKEPPLRKKVKKPFSKKTVSEDFWVQVYDTDSAEEARKIRLKFQDLAIQCFLYEQGKKDVYGNVMKRYGISVPRKNAEKAQAILAEFTL